MLGVSVRFSMRMVLKLRTITTSVFLTPSATVGMVVEKMSSHYCKHGLREMKFKNVYDYTNAARNVIANGKYIAQKNAYAMFIKGKKAAFVGVGHGNTLITTYSYRTLTVKKLIEFELII